MKAPRRKLDIGATLVALLVILGLAAQSLHVHGHDHDHDHGHGAHEVEVAEHHCDGHDHHHEPEAPDGDQPEGPFEPEDDCEVCLQIAATDSPELLTPSILPVLLRAEIANFPWQTVVAAESSRQPPARAPPVSRV